MICIINRVALLVLGTFLCLDSYAQVTSFYWTDITGIHKVNVDGSGYDTLVDVVFRSPVKIALDPENQHIYWIDEGLKEIRRAGLEGSQVEALLKTGDFPGSLALDMAGGKMYWTEFGVVKRANIDGSGEEELTSIPGFQEGIALDIAAGKMYWAAKNLGIIRKANLDGTGVGTVAGGLVRPEGVALDIPAGKIYWTFASGIARANLDGTEEEVIVSDIVDPIDIELNPQAGKVYWTERKTQKVRRANLDGSDVEDLTPTGLAKPTSILIDVESETLYWIGGSEASIRRSDLDFAGTEVVIANKIRAPLGIVLDLDAGKMYWADGEASRVQRANLDGSDIENVLEFAVGYPDQIFLDLDAGKIYWTDNDPDSVSFAFRRANLDGSDLEDLSVAGEGVAAVDFESGKVYSFLGASEVSRTIFRQNMDGTEVEELIADVPLTDLALDIPGGKLYWTEGTNEANIKRVNLDGTEMETVFDFSSRLNDLRHIAIDSQERKMYWVNNGAAMEEIWRGGLDGSLGLDGGLREYLITSPILQGVYDLALSYEEPTSTRASATQSVRSARLTQPYPNPFMSTITFEVEYDQPGPVRLDIYDMLGRRIATVFEGVLLTGKHRVVWDSGSTHAGVYMARLQSESYVENRRIIKIR